MYNLIKAYAKGSTTNYRYVLVPLDNIPINYIYKLYVDVVIQVSSTLETELFYISLAFIRPTFYNSELKIQQILDTFANLELPGRIVFTPNVKQVNYSDALQAGYKINKCKIGVHPLNPYPEYSKSDLYITRPGYTTDVKLLTDYALVTVNGYLHRTVNDGDFQYIVDGGNTLSNSNYNYAGIISFSEIGKVKEIPITETMIYRQDNNLPYYNKLYINTGIDLTNKTVMMSLGGYLLFTDITSFIIVNETTISLSLEAMPYFQRLLESADSIDLSNVLLHDPKDGLLDVIDAKADDTVLKYLTLPQSFIIVLDNVINVSKVKINSSNIPNKLLTNMQPMFPLVTGFGRLAEYWSVFEDGMWSINVNDNRIKNFNFTYSNPTTLKLITDSQLPRDKIKQNKAHFLEIVSS